MVYVFFHMKSAASKTLDLERGSVIRCTFRGRFRRFRQVLILPLAATHTQTSQKIAHSVSKPSTLCNSPTSKAPDQRPPIEFGSL